MTDLVVLLITFEISGILLAALSVPLIIGRIPPNGLYGFRVRKTLQHPEIWYPVNAFAGKRLLVASLGNVLAAVILFFVPNLGLEPYAYAVLILWVVGFTIAIVSTLRYMNSLYWDPGKKTRRAAINSARRVFSWILPTPGTTR
jgi:SdpI/YfhL protein family